MVRGEERMSIAGPAGALELALNLPAQAPRGIALVAHPHPLQGGTMDNKVVQTLAKTFFAWATSASDSIFAASAAAPAHSTMAPARPTTRWPRWPTPARGSASAAGGSRRIFVRDVRPDARRAGK